MNNFSLFLCLQFAWEPIKVISRKSRVEVLDSSTTARTMIRKRPRQSQFSALKLHFHVGKINCNCSGLICHCITRQFCMSHVSLWLFMKTFPSMTEKKAFTWQPQAPNGMTFYGKLPQSWRDPSGEANWVFMFRFFGSAPCSFEASTCVIIR